jgi:hypothetical protein
MRIIKSFRLFESISGESQIEERIVEIAGIYEDAKTIEYILEEGGYDFSWRIVTEYRSYDVHDDLPDLIRVNSFSGDGSVFHHDFLKPVKIRINILGINGELFTSDEKYRLDYKNDIERFKNLLEEHLDYLPSDSISLEASPYVYKLDISI